MIKKRTQSKNGAIQGRRNRLHNLPIVVRYDAYDVAAKKEIEKQLMDSINHSKWVMLPEQGCRIVNMKKPRLIAMPEHNQLQEEIDELYRRLELVERNYFRYVSETIHQEEDIKRMFYEMLKSVK